MPLRYFICPDKQQIEVKDCLKENGCRMGERCGTRSYLQLAAKERPLRYFCRKCGTEHINTKLE